MKLDNPRFIVIVNSQKYKNKKEVIMKKLLHLFVVMFVLGGSILASEVRDTTLNIYGVNAKVDKDEGSSSGVGIMFDSESIKIKIEGTSDFIKSGAVLKFNPVTNKWYIKVGANYINQKMYASDNSTARVNQFSGSLATGYMIQNDLYVELGASLSELNGKKLGTDYEIVDETTKLAYIEVAKRFEIDYATIDITLNTGRIFKEFSSDENSYGGGIDIYPSFTNNLKVGYKYQNEKDNISNTYNVQYGYGFIEYVDKISTDTYQVNMGIKIAFSNLFDPSTYKMPTKIKPHLSELHRFEDISFSNNMNIQSTKGVQSRKTNTKTTTPAVVSTPILTTIATQNVDDNGGGLATSILTVSGTNINTGAVFSIVSDPTSGGLTINATTGALTYDADVVGNKVYSITVKILNTDGGSDTVTFTLNVTDNA